jgi:DNA polymerase III delta prime subunit
MRSVVKHAILLDGPIGTGKTTLGRALAERLSGGFIDGDAFADPDHPWYCSILRTSQSIVHNGAGMLATADVVVIAYPLGCINWIYFRRKFIEAGASPFFVGLHASYEAIVDERRGRSFTSEEHDRIQVMIAEGYGTRPFSDLMVDTDKADFAMTLAALERRIRHMLVI